MSRPVKITTVARARALPEIKHAFLDSVQRILEEDIHGVGKRGDTIIEHKVRPFCAKPIDGDQILIFLDSDGRSMQVVYTPDGPAKTPFYL